MGVQLAGGPRSVHAELNLVPFIDLLSVLIAFLLTAAVWIQFASLPVEAGSSGVNSDSAPLLVRIGRDGASVGWGPGAPMEFPRSSRGLDWGGIERAIAGANTAERAMDVTADDGVAYGEVVRALDLGRANGFTAATVGGR